MSDPIRIQLRTKTSGVIDNTTINEREIQFENYGSNRNIVIRGYNETTLYKYYPTNDSATTLYNTWTANKINSVIGDASTAILNYVSNNYSLSNHTHSYYSLTSRPNRTIILSSGSLIPHTASTPCNYPSTGGDSDSPFMSVEIGASEAGYWGFLIPSDYTGLIQNITISYYGITSSNNILLTVRSTGDDVDKNTSTLAKSLTLTLPGKTSGDNIGIYTYSTPTDFFGNSTNANKFGTIILSNSGANTIYLTGMKIEY